MTPAHPPRAEDVTLNGLRHQLLRWDGESSAGTLVLLHGYLDVARSFGPFVTALRTLPGGPWNVPTIVAPDLRGHGRSAWVGAGGYYHFADYVADVAALLDTLQGPIFLLGHSMGGTIASLVAGTFPEKVRALVLVEGLGPASHRDDDAPERMATWIRQVEASRQRVPTPMKTLEIVADRLRASNPALPAELAAAIAGDASRPVDGGFAWAFDPLHKTRSPSPFDVETYRLFLKRITAPTLLVEGGASPFRDFIADERESDVARLEKARIEDATHMLHHERPEALARIVDAFLSKVTS